jgi:hypothetical protein
MARVSRKWAERGLGWEARKRLEKRARRPTCWLHVADPARRGCVRRHSLGLSAMVHLFAVLLHIPEAAGHHAHGFASRKENPLV